MHRMMAGKLSRLDDLYDVYVFCDFKELTSTWRYGTVTIHEPHASVRERWKNRSARNDECRHICSQRFIACILHVNWRDLFEYIHKNCRIPSIVYIVWIFVFLSSVYSWIKNCMMSKTKTAFFWNFQMKAIG